MIHRLPQSATLVVGNFTTGPTSLRIEVNMNTDRLLSVLKTVQIVIDCLVAAIGLIVLSLSANLISFTNLYKHADVSVSKVSSASSSVH